MRRTTYRTRTTGGAVAILATIALSTAGVTAAQATEPQHPAAAVINIPETADGFFPAELPLLTGSGSAPESLADDDLVVDVPDPVLATALRGHLGSDELTRGKLRTITWLNLNDLEIEDLTGLEFATRLSDFEMQRTRVTSLAPLSGATNLAYFFAGGSPISSIEPFAGLPRLNYVSLNSTQITDISALAGAPKLVRLEIAATRVESLAPLAQVTTLREIYAQETLVSDLDPLGGLTELRTISIPNAEVSDLHGIAGLPELTILNVNSNHVADLSMFESWPKLQQVGFTGQKLSLGTVYPSATETTFVKTDIARDFMMPSDSEVSVESGSAEPMGGSGARWSGIDPETTAVLSAEVSHLLGESSARYAATATYPAVFADFDSAPAEGSVISVAPGEALSLDFSTIPEFTGGAYALDGAPELELSSDGELTGSFDRNGEFATTVSLTDRDGNTITRTFSVRVVQPAPGPGDSGAETPADTGRPDPIAVTGGTPAGALWAAGAALGLLGAYLGFHGLRRRAGA